MSDKSDSSILGVKASGVTVNIRPDGVIEIYVSQKRYEWAARPIGRNYEVITITPKEGIVPVVVKSPVDTLIDSS
jgi:hypothetical protein